MPGPEPGTGSTERGEGRPLPGHIYPGGKKKKKDVLRAPGEQELQTRKQENSALVNLPRILQSEILERSFKNYMSLLSVVFSNEECFHFEFHLGRGHGKLFKALGH